jgi:hypothetical protein
MQNRHFGQLQGEKNGKNLQADFIAPSVRIGAGMQPAIG